MKPIRVQLKYHNPYSFEYKGQDFEREFDGKTGTLVWIDNTGWSGYSVSVELDVPHSRFGKLINQAYMAEEKGRDLIAEVIEGSTMDEVREMARVIKGSWDFRAKNGDSLPFSVFSPMYDKALERYNRINEESDNA